MDQGEPECTPWASGGPEAAGTLPHYHNAIVFHLGDDVYNTAGRCVGVPGWKQRRGGVGLRVCAPRGRGRTSVGWLAAERRGLAPGAAARQPALIPQPRLSSEV